MADAKPATKPRAAEATGFTPIDVSEFRVIRALHPAFMAMMKRIDADLQHEHRMSHAEYMALMFLSEAADRTLGLSELARRCQQSLSAVSRTVGRMEAQGLVRREQSDQDARAYNAVLTDAGLNRVQQATPGHVDSLRRYLFDHLGGIDLDALADAFERIAVAASGDAHVVPGRPAPDTPIGQHISN
ncbi:MarR family winged helix-turn-helix transcriptional regulator [Mycobacterium arosiense]|uniref:MarR family transcriptional regulator n=1 Tax=Mycobacterium arosiense ATCC BAA-1401 = DSM 45069 TaxID=1265311 RepID=A0A1W9Z7H5_MYCAI|nr:MarR family winged helix-turn-helix transcriptional regulator [Mycobacterium arosiense]ORA08382.1 MarR family transcriptional regulator [Mycobacterium arosiense ATCC BAA-1401 = DSM 45069]